jgi:hypothetical protein
MSQKSEKRRLPPALPKCSSSSQKKILSHNPEQPREQAQLAFFKKYGDLIQLRRAGKSLQEIADEIGGSRIEVFRVFQKLPSNKLKLQLGVPT